MTEGPSYRDIEEGRIRPNPKRLADLMGIDIPTSAERGKRELTRRRKQHPDWQDLDIKPVSVFASDYPPGTTGVYLEMSWEGRRMSLTDYIRLRIESIQLADTDQHDGICREETPEQRASRVDELNNLLHIIQAA